MVNLAALLKPKHSLEAVLFLKDAPRAKAESAKQAVRVSAAPSEQLRSKLRDKHRAARRQRDGQQRFPEISDNDRHREADRR